MAMHNKLVDKNDELTEQNKIMREALLRLTKVGPPSKSCSGDEWAVICLEDNCGIAKQALAKCGSTEPKATLPIDVMSTANLTGSSGTITGGEDK